MNFGPSDGVQPVEIDTSVRFSSIGGLKEHIRCLREMIIFPLMYPELFKKFNTRPAKGILFHGPPGTGKTLLARALANECSLVGGRRVSFFMRKGADVLNKYYGESERNLQMLFKTARKMKPSIIFFDEIDALAPIRRPTNDNTHCSVVAILLAEMDGVCDRGDVVVIGATNRPEAMDPAVRRAGRFDRELYFPPPKAEDRRDILEIYTRDWDPSLSDETLDHLARISVGYLGSDIKALCSEAVIKAVRRVYPQIYESDSKLLVNAQNVEVTTDDMLEAMEEITPTGARYAPHAARALPPHTIPLLDAQLKEAAELMKRTFPVRNKCNKGKNDLRSAPSVFLVTGECAESLLAPALLAQLEHCLVKELSVSTLHAAHVQSPGQAVISLFAECRRSGRDCVIFIRDLKAVWNVLAKKNGSEVLLQLLRVGSVGEHTLLLAAINCRHSQLPKALKEAFPTYKDCIYRVRKPTEAEVTNFLQPVITELPLVPPIVYQYVPPPPLPKAPTGPLENEQDVIRRLYREYDNLRLLRCSLKNICRNLSADRRFKRFSTSVECDSLPDYYSVVKNPMDLATIMSKIDNKKYFCARDFLDDIDLICENALLYDKAKPDKIDKNFRHEACELHNTAYTMVVDEIPAALELECQLIAKRHRESGDDDDEPEPNGWSDNFYISKLDNFDPNEEFFKKDPCRKRHSLETKEPLAKRPRLNTERSLVIKDNVDEKKFKDFVKDRVEDGIIIRAVVNTKTDTPAYINVTNCNEKQSDPNITSSDVDPRTKEVKDDVLPKVNQLRINEAELGEIMKYNVKRLCLIGLEALIDLHAQLRRTVYGYSQLSDRRRLPRELDAIIARYVRHARK